MPDGILLAAALIANLVGMGWLALAMDAHWKQVVGGDTCPPSTVGILRVLGTLALAGSLMLCLAVDHASMAVLVWIMALAAAAITIAFMLAHRAYWLRVLVPLRG